MLTRRQEVYSVSLLIYQLVTKTAHNLHKSTFFYNIVYKLYTILI